MESGLDWWRLIEVSGVWAAAFATFLAAQTAIWIARRQDQIRLRISVVEGVIFEDDEVEDVVWVTITNVSRRSATVNALGWRMSSLTRMELYQKVDPPNRPLPYLLRDGDQISVIFPVRHPDREDWYKMLAERFSRFGALRREFEMRMLRFRAVCTTGDVFEVRPNKGFMVRLRRAFEMSQNEKMNRGSKQ